MLIHQFKYLSHCKLTIMMSSRLCVFVYTNMMPYTGKLAVEIEHNVFDVLTNRVTINNASVEHHAM